MQRSNPFTRYRKKDWYGQHGNGFVDHEAIDEDDLADDIWTDSALFAIDVPHWEKYASQSPSNDSDISFRPHPSNGKKRGSDAIDFSDDDAAQQAEYQRLVEQFKKDFPDLSPALPSSSVRDVPQLLLPACSEGDPRHPKLRNMVVLDETGNVNSYIKFRLRMADVEADAGPKRSIFDRTPTLGPKLHQDTSPSPFGLDKQQIAQLPPDFGRGLKLDPADAKLMKFFIVAYCQGRTLLNKSNLWHNNIAPMACANECVKHALLAFAGTYVLDYLRSPDLLARTNKHYRLAVESINKALNDTETFEIGKGDAVVSALLLLMSDDIVTWELRKTKGLVPTWYENAHIANQLLDKTDPGFRYWKTRNVQFDTARLANANYVAYACILAGVVTPLPFDQGERVYGWLLEGTEAEIRKIHGSTGVSPKLLHMFAQITRLSVKLQNDPESEAILIGGGYLRRKLQNFHQHSDLSGGFTSIETLFKECVLDEDGKVSTAAKVTELTGETWVAAAQIYLECRLFRKPRSHEDVQRPLKRLLQCLIRMPYEGSLFTSQSPFFPIVLSALTSIYNRERTLTREWFETIVSNASCRSSVPPVWEIVKRQWTWFDTYHVDAEYNDHIPVGQRVPWWENFVSHLMETEGFVSLT